jgi:hypothetical protein
MYRVINLAEDEDEFDFSYIYLSNLRN